MKTLILKNQTASGENLQAVFSPDQGMNLISYRLDDLEIIDQNTREQFEERFAGLGPLIGPHFHRRRSESLPTIKKEALFPHIARVKAHGIADPFSHGIGRYAPWQIQKATSTEIKASLSGKDVWEGESLASLEGQNFNMSFHAEMTASGLKISLSVVSDKDSLVGIHYYYHLPQGTGTVTSRVQSRMIENGESKTIPSEWKLDSQNVMRYTINQAVDHTFYPFPNPLQGHIVLDAIDYQLITTYSCNSEENSWQLYHPEGASFVCIEPVSAQDPHHPNLTVSSLNIQLHILRPGQKHE